MAKMMKKMPRKMSPEKAEQEAMAAQVMAMMGEGTPSPSFRGRELSPAEMDAMAMGELSDDMSIDEDSRIINPRGGVSPKSSNASERAKFQQRQEGADGGEEGYDVDDEPTDGMISDYTNKVLNELGDAAYDMDSQELFNSLGWSMNPTALAALDKLDPEERIELIRATAGDPITEEGLAQMADETRARRPMNMKDQRQMDEVQGDVLKRMGVE